MHLMHYCEACTAPKMPEFILYAFHSAYQKLPWRDLHPDQMLMEAFFKVSPLLSMPQPGVLGAACSLWVFSPVAVCAGVDPAHILNRLGGAYVKQHPMDVILLC